MSIDKKVKKTRKKLIKYFSQNESIKNKEIDEHLYDLIDSNISEFNFSENFIIKAREDEGYAGVLQSYIDGIPPEEIIEGLMVAVNILKTHLYGLEMNYELQSKSKYGRNN